MKVSDRPVSNGAADGWLARLQTSALMHALERSALLCNLVLAVLWMSVWQLGLLVKYSPHASLWFPVAGLTFSVLLLDGLRCAPGLVAACVLTTLWVGHQYQLPLSQIELVRAGLLWSCAHIGSYYAGARLLRAIASKDGGQPAHPDCQLHGRRRHRFAAVDSDRAVDAGNNQHDAGARS